MVRATQSARVPPHNLEAEEALLGAMLLSTDAIDAAAETLLAEDFYRPIHSAVFDAIVRLRNKGEPTDPVTVHNIIERLGMSETLGGLAALLSLQANTPATSNARKYASIIADHSALRRLVAVAGEIAELAYGVPDDVHDTIDRAKMLLESLELPMDAGVPSPDVATFIDSVSGHYDWIVPGLIERMERLIITGSEGFGKSTALRQMAVAIASGMHPFEYYPFEMTRGGLPNVMIAEFENSERQVKRKLAGLLEIEGVHRNLDPRRLRLEVHPEGVNLLSRAAARWLEGKVAANRPDILMIGPVYKMYEGSLKDEEVIDRLLSFLDRLRIRYDCALVLEAHSPHAEPGQKRDLRPIGSSIWMRWPEFGYGLAPIKDDPAAALFQHWRGDRDERDWPRRLVRGASVGNPWPWGTGRDAGRVVHPADDGGYVPDGYDEANDF